MWRGRSSDMRVGSAGHAAAARRFTGPSPPDARVAGGWVGRVPRGLPGAIGSGEERETPWQRDLITPIWALGVDGHATGGHPVDAVPHPAPARPTRTPPDAPPFGVNIAGMFRSEK